MLFCAAMSVLNALGAASCFGEESFEQIYQHYNTRITNDSNQLASLRQMIAAIPANTLTGQEDARKQKLGQVSQVQSDLRGVQNKLSETASDIQKAKEKDENKATRLLNSPDFPDKANQLGKLETAAQEKLQQLDKLNDLKQAADKALQQGAAVEQAAQAKVGNPKTPDGASAKSAAAPKPADKAPAQGASPTAAAPGTGASSDKDLQTKAADSPGAGTAPSKSAGVPKSAVKTAVASPPKLARDMKFIQGDHQTGNDVKVAQHFLNSELKRAGINKRIPEDGEFGPQTRNAVRDFNRRNGLGRSSTINERSWKALYASAMSQPEPATTEPTDSLPASSAAKSTRAKAVASASRASQDRGSKASGAEAPTFRSPIKDDTWVTSGYGRPRSHGSHKGADFHAPKGTEIYSAAEGTVRDTGYSETHGKYVIVDHADGSRTKYFHLSRILAEEGQHVDNDTLIGKSGNTGSTSQGAHLHFEYEDSDGNHRNPAVVLGLGGRGSGSGASDQYASYQAHQDDGN